MSIQFDSYLRIILFQSRLCASSLRIDSYSLTFSLLSSSLETEVISLPDITFRDKSFYFEMPKPPISQPIEITAKSKSMYLIKKTICKVSIPSSSVKCPQQRQWYFLKSNDNENILKVLIAFQCGVSNGKINDLDMSYTNNTLLLRDKTNMSASLSLSKRYYNIRDRLKLREKRLSEERDKDKDRYRFRYSDREGNANSKSYCNKVNLTLSRSHSIELLNCNYKPKLSILNEHEYENEHCDNDNDNDNNNENRHYNQHEIMSMLKDKLNSINELQKQINNDIRYIKQEELRLKQNGQLLYKEQLAFTHSIREYNLSEHRHNKSSLELVSNYSKYDLDNDIQSIQSEIDDYDKQTFLNMNLIYNSNIYLMPKDKSDFNTGINAYNGNSNSNSNNNSTNATTNTTAAVTVKGNASGMKNKIVNLRTTTAKKDKTKKKMIKGNTHHKNQHHNEYNQPSSNKHIIRADSSSNIKDSKVKHLNSTNFTSNCSEMYYSILNNNNNNSNSGSNINNSNNSNAIHLDFILGNSNTSNSSKHLTSKMNIKKSMHNKKESKDSRIIDSIDSHTHKSFYPTSNQGVSANVKKPVKDFDNIKVIKIKAKKVSSSKTNKSSKKNKTNKNYIYLRSSNNSSNSSHNNNHNHNYYNNSNNYITSRKQTSTTMKSIDKSQTISSLKESSSAQNFLIPSRHKIVML